MTNYSCAVCDSLGNYILNSSDASCNSVKIWNRDISRSSNVFYPNKTKYYILKNPPSTVRSPPRLVVCNNSPKTVNIGNIAYIIDATIYDTVVTLLQTNPVNTLDKLRLTIAEARRIQNKPAPLSVQLRDVPLSNILTTRTYTSIGDTWRSSKSVPKNVVGSFFKSGDILNRLFSDTADFLPYINFWKGKFNNREMNLKKAIYFYAQTNDGCGYSSTYNSLYTTSLRSGSTILPANSIQLFQKTGIIYFDPFPSSSGALSLMLAFLVSTDIVKPGTYPAKFGAIFIADDYWLNGIPDVTKPGLGGKTLRTLIRNEIKANSELIFIPIESQLDLIESIPLGRNTGFYFPYTNGGNATTQINLVINQLKNKFGDVTTTSNQSDFSFSTTFQQQIT